MALSSLCLILLVLWTLLAYVAIPLPFEDPFFAWLRRQWLMEGIAGLSFLGVIAVACSQWRRRIPQPARPWWIWWWVWMGWAVFSIVYSIDRGVSMRSALAWLSYGLLAYLASTLVRSSRDVIVWVRFLVSVAIVAGLEGLFQYGGTFKATLPLLEHLQGSGQLHLQGWGDVVIKDFLIRKRITSVFGWPNLFAGFLLLTIPLAAALGLQSPHRLGRLGWITAAGLLGLCLLLTLSMGAWIAAILTGSLGWWLLGSQTGERGRRRVARIVKPLGLGAVVIIIVFVTSFIVAQRARTFIRTSASSRIAYVQGAWNILQPRLLMGTGVGTFGIAYQSLKPREPGEGEYSAQHAHSTLLEIGAELGVVGLVCFAIFLLQAGRLMAAAIRGPADTGTLWLRRGLAIGLLGFFTHSLLEQTFVEAVTAPFWWIVLGLVTGAVSLARSSDVQGRQLQRSPQLVFLLVICCLGLGAVARYAAADMTATHGAWMDLAGHADRGRTAFEQARRYDPLTHRYPLEQGQRYLNAVQGRAPDEAGPLLKHAEREFLRAVSLSPWLGQAWLRLGLVRWQLGHAEAAIDTMKTAVQRDPNSRAATAHLARMLLAAGRFREAVEAGRAFQRLEPGSPLGYFWEALGWERVGTAEQAEEGYRKLLARFPDYYRALFNLATLLRQQGATAEAAVYYEAFLRAAPATQQEARREAEIFLHPRTGGEGTRESP